MQVSDSYLLPERQLNSAKQVIVFRLSVCQCPSVRAKKTEKKLPIENLCNLVGKCVTVNPKVVRFLVTSDLDL